MNLPDKLRVVDGVIGTNDGTDVVEYLKDSQETLRVEASEPMVLIPRARIEKILFHLESYRRVKMLKRQGKNPADGSLPATLRVVEGVLCMEDGSDVVTYLKSRHAKFGLTADEPMTLITRAHLVSLVGELEDFRRGEKALNDERFILAA